MAADIRLASDNSQFGIPAAKLGIAYGYDGLKHLVSLVGPSWARLLMYTGMRIDSAEALRIGLVDRVVADAELWNATLEIARTISGNAPLAIQAAKITIAQVLKDPDQRDMDAIKAIGTACMDSEDFPRGTAGVHGKAQAEVQGTIISEDDRSPISGTLICAAVQPLLKKYSDFPNTQISSITAAVPSR